ncbi:hypothetical protein ACVMHW_005519 [Bradyrhizobium diazoefficiens]
MIKGTLTFDHALFVKFAFGLFNSRKERRRLMDHAQFSG